MVSVCSDPSFVPLSLLFCSFSALPAALRGSVLLGIDADHFFFFLRVQVNPVD